MTTAVLKLINEQLSLWGINYEFGEWTTTPIPYPYFVGSYAKREPLTEDGLCECDFTLDGFTRGAWLDLEFAKEIIEKVFSNCTRILENGSGVDVSYSGSLIIPTGDDELKRIQIKLNIKEWKVIE